MDNKISLAIVLVIIGVSGLSWAYFGRGEIGIERAHGIAERYLEAMGNPDIAIAEVMEFEYNYYVVYYEKSTGIGAFEMLIDKSSGRIFPEYGPNMMWNINYGHGSMMGGFYQPPSGKVIGEEGAIDIAQAFLDEVYPGSKAEDPHPFYGYYTIHTAIDEEIFGMLSVNVFDGVVWYHDWHGEYIRSLEPH